MLASLKQHPFAKKIITFFHHRETLRSSFILIFWMFASRGLGAFRTILVTRLSTLEADMLNGAMVITDNIITVFILGAVTTSILPQIIKLSVSSSDENRSRNQSTYLSWIMLILGGFLFITSFVCILFSPQILQLLNQQLFAQIQQQGRGDDFVLLTRLMLLVPTLFGVKSIFTAFLNAKKAFSIFALDGVIINLGFIFGLVVLYSFFGLSGVVWGNVLGMAVATTLFIWSARKNGFRFQIESFPELKKYLLQTAHLYFLWILLIPGIRVASTIVAMNVDGANGEITAVNLSLDIQSIFLGIVASIGSVVLPNMALLAAEKNHTRFWAYIFKYLRWIGFLSFFGAILTIAGTPLLIWLIQNSGILQNDSFLSIPENVQNVTLFASIGAFSLVFQSLIEILYRYFSSTENPYPPIIASIFGNACAITTAFFFSSTWSAGLVAVVGFSINNVVVFFILLVAMYRLWRADHKYALHKDTK